MKKIVPYLIFLIFQVCYSDLNLELSREKNFKVLALSKNISEEINLTIMIPNHQMLLSMIVINLNL